MLLVVLLYGLFDEDGQVWLGLQHSFPRTNMDQILEDIVAAVLAASPQTIKIDILVNHCRIVIFAEFEQV